jgi:hypothetical protein
MSLAKLSPANRSSLAACVLILLLAACQQAAKPAIASTAAPAASAAWDAYASGFLESYFVAQPGVAVWAGRHEFDGKLPDWSAAGIKREIQRLHSERDNAAAFPNEALDARQRFERDYLIARIDRDLFWQESLEWPFRSPTYYSFALEPDVYVARAYAPLPERLRAYSRYARSIPAAAGQIRANLRTRLPRTYVQIGHILFGGLANPTRTGPRRSGTRTSLEGRICFLSPRMRSGPATSCNSCTQGAHRSNWARFL